MITFSTAVAAFAITTTATTPNCASFGGSKYTAKQMNSVAEVVVVSEGAVSWPMRGEAEGQQDVPTRGLI